MSQKYSIKKWVFLEQRLLIDVETFDYAYFQRGAQGVRVSLSHPLDRPLMDQTGFYVSTGLSLMICSF